MTEQDDLAGRTIVRTRPMTAGEMAREGWDWGPPPLVLELDSGLLLYPSRDEEGNGPGVLFGHDPRLDAGVVFFPPAPA